MNNPKDDLTAAILVLLGALVGVPLLMFGLIILRAFIICQIWGWYIAPFFGLPMLTLIYAFGLSCFISLFTTKTTGMKADKMADEHISAKEKFNISLTSFLLIFIIWGMAAIGTIWLPENTEQIEEPVAIEQIVEQE